MKETNISAADSIKVQLKNNIKYIKSNMTASPSFNINIKNKS